MAAPSTKACLQVIRFACPRITEGRECFCTLKERIACTNYVPTTFDVDFLTKHGFQRIIGGGATGDRNDTSGRSGRVNDSAPRIVTG